MMSEASLKYLYSFLGRPYKWGGSNPMTGFDCSGLAQEILASCGMDLPGDQTAQAYFEHFSKHGIKNCFGPGALAFYGQSELAVTHITMMINEWQCIGANGGGSKTTDLDSAIKADAFVKVRPVDYRSDMIGIYMPKY